LTSNTAVDNSSINGRYICVCGIWRKRPVVDIHIHFKYNIIKDMVEGGIQAIIQEGDHGQ